MFKIYLDNRIAYDGANYRCYLCDVRIPFTTEIDCHSVLKHLLNEQHHRILNSIDKSRRINESTELCKVSTNEWIKIVKNHITFDTIQNYFRCYICDCSIEGVNNAVAHIDSTLHQMQCQILYIKENYKSSSKALLPQNNQSRSLNNYNYLDGKLKKSETSEQIKSSRLINVKSQIVQFFYCNRERSVYKNRKN